MLYTNTQLIFLCSKANGCDNMQDLLPVHRWPWPTNGWLTRRMAELREQEKERNNEG